MWSRYHWLTGRVRLRRAGSGTNVFVPIPPLSLSAARSAILSADGLLGLIPGSAGRAARAGADALQKALFVMLDEGLDVDVKAKGGNEDVKVRVRMV
jgi:hypothetical protein